MVQQPKTGFMLVTMLAHYYTWARVCEFIVQLKHNITHFELCGEFCCVFTYQVLGARLSLCTNLDYFGGSQQSAASQ